MLVHTDKKPGYALLRNDNNLFIDVTEISNLPNLYPRTAAWGDYDNDGDLDLFLGRSNNSFKDSLVWDNNNVKVITRTKSSQKGLSLIVSKKSIINFDLWRVDRILNPRQIMLGQGKNPDNNPFTLSYSEYKDLVKPDYAIGYGKPRVYIWYNESKDRLEIRWNGAGEFRTSGLITTKGYFTNVEPQNLKLNKLNKPSYNKLLKNNGDGTFTVDRSFKDEFGYNTYNGQWIDFDNDADLDLYVTNFGDTQIGNQSNQLYINHNGSFIDIADDAGLARPTENNETCSTWADFNNDGFQDVFVVNSSYAGYLAGPHSLFQNNGNQNNWIEIILTGRKSNSLGIGSRIEIYIDDNFQMREVQGSSANGCNNSLVTHFGLGDEKLVDKIVVRWPSGYNQTLHNIKSNQIIDITEPEK